MVELLFEQHATSFLAVATTVHLAVLLLRAHRNPTGRKYDALLLPCLVFCGTPWMFPTTLGIASGSVLHLAWFIVSDRFVPDPPAPVVTPTATIVRPQPAPAAASRPVPGFVKTPVIGVFRETEDITTFRMVRPEGFEFRPGQFVTVRVKVDGKPVSRCYSISSAPETTGYLEISVKRQGLVSGLLHATIRPGSSLEVRSPAGVFVYPEGDARPVVFIAGGIGITPVMSMLRHSLQADPTRPVTLLYSVHGQRDVVFRDELRWITQRHPHASVVITTTRGPHSTEYLSGRIDRRLLTEHVPDLTDRVFLICGPGAMIDAMKATLAELGVPSDQVRFEAFESAIAAANAPDAATSDAAPPTEPAMSAAGFQLRLVASGRTIAVDGARTLLESCEAANVEIPSVCRAGVCGSCRSRLLEGDVRCESDVLSAADRAQGYILPCVSWPTGDCALEA